MKVRIILFLLTICLHAQSMEPEKKQVRFVNAPEVLEKKPIHRYQKRAAQERQLTIPVEGFETAREPGKPSSEDVVREADIEIAKEDPNPLADLPDVVAEADKALEEIAWAYTDLESYGTKEDYERKLAQMEELLAKLDRYAYEIKNRINLWKSKIINPRITEKNKKLMQKQLEVMQNKNRIVILRIKTINGYTQRISDDIAQKESESQTPE